MQVANDRLHYFDLTRKNIDLKHKANATLDETLTLGTP